LKRALSAHEKHGDTRDGGKTYPGGGKGQERLPKHTETQGGLLHVSPPCEIWGAKLFRSTGPAGKVIRLARKRNS